jgi:hypothetical protein
LASKVDWVAEIEGLVTSSGVRPQDAGAKTPQIRVEAGEGLAGCGTADGVERRIDVRCPRAKFSAGVDNGAPPVLGVLLGAIG